MIVKKTKNKSNFILKDNLNNIMIFKIYKEDLLFNEEWNVPLIKLQSDKDDCETEFDNEDYKKKLYQKIEKDIKEVISLSRSLKAFRESFPQLFRFKLLK